MSYTVYGDIQSGNCFKIRLVLDQLGLSYRWQHVDILKQESRTPDFLRKNPNGKIPVLALPDGTFLFESGAILLYLGEKTGRQRRAMRAPRARAARRIRRSAYRSSVLHLFPTSWGIVTGRS